VADVLFGKRPFTGRLPVSWPASVAQVPVNVGDRDYHPLYPFGWGLRTGGHVPSAPATPAGALSTDAASLRRASATVRGGDPAGRDAVLDAARDAAQARVVAGHGGAQWQARLAAADQAQTAGEFLRAFTLYASVITA